MSLPSIVFGIIVLLIYAYFAACFILSPQRLLRNLGRPTSEKHVRVVRIVGGGFAVLLLLGVLRCFAESEYNLLIRL